MLSNAVNPMVSNKTKVEEVTVQLDEVAETMRQNVQFAMRNLDSTSQLADRTETLSANANRFTRTARGVRRKMWWKNCKYTLYCILAVFILGGGAALLAQTIKEESSMPNPPSPPDDTR